MVLTWDTYLLGWTKAFHVGLIVSYHRVKTILSALSNEMLLIDEVLYRLVGSRHCSSPFVIVDTVPPVCLGVSVVSCAWCLHIPELMTTLLKTQG